MNYVHVMPQSLPLTALRHFSLTGSTQESDLHIEFSVKEEVHGRKKNERTIMVIIIVFQ